MKSPMKYRKKDGVVEAIRFDMSNKDDRDNWEVRGGLMEFCLGEGAVFHILKDGMGFYLVIAGVRVNDGDWVVLASDGEWFPVFAAKFQNEYELAELPDNRDVLAAALGAKWESGMWLLPWDSEWLTVPEWQDAIRRVRRQERQARSAIEDVRDALAPWSRSDVEVGIGR